MEELVGDAHARSWTSGVLPIVIPNYGQPTSTLTRYVCYVMFCHHTCGCASAVCKQAVIALFIESNSTNWRGVKRRRRFKSAFRSWFDRTSLLFNTVLFLSCFRNFHPSGDGQNSVFPFQKSLLPIRGVHNYDFRFTFLRFRRFFAIFLRFTKFWIVNRKSS